MPGLCRGEVVANESEDPLELYTLEYELEVLDTLADDQQTGESKNVADTEVLTFLQVTELVFQLFQFEAVNLFENKAGVIGGFDVTVLINEEGNGLLGLDLPTDRFQRRPLTPKDRVNLVGNYRYDTVGLFDSLIVTCLTRREGLRDAP